MPEAWPLRNKGIAMRKPQHIITIHQGDRWMIAIDGEFYDSFRTRELAMERALLWARTAMQQESRVQILVPDGAGRLRLAWRNGDPVELEAPLSRTG